MTKMAVWVLKPAYRAKLNFGFFALFLTFCKNHIFGGKNLKNSKSDIFGGKYDSILDNVIYMCYN